MLCSNGRIPALLCALVSLFFAGPDFAGGNGPGSAGGDSAGSGDAVETRRLDCGFRPAERWLQDYLDDIASGRITTPAYLTTPVTVRSNRTHADGGSV